MRKVAIVCMSFVLCIVIGCKANQNAPVSEPNVTATPSVTAMPSITATPSVSLPPKPTAGIAELPEYPVIDGSTSTVMMHLAIRARLTGAEFSMNHSKTYDALERLIPGSKNPADVLLSVKYYDETLEDAAKRGAELVITPIAKEGFIFIVHKDNPISSLTSQQLKDIYTGEIKTWDKVGGENKRISVYTRNIFSGSRTALEIFMGKNVLVEGDDVTLKATMGSMLAALGQSDKAAIGYSVYSWATQPSLEEAGLKALAVDGILPTNETIANGEYPLLNYTYAYYNKDNAKGERLTNWLLSEDGQKTIASAGYVGLYGELPSRERRAFDKDEQESRIKAMDYYFEIGLGEYVKFEKHYLDKRNIEALSAGKGKDISVVWLCKNYAPGGGLQRKAHLRFIVLTRSKDSAFEVINEGKVAKVTKDGKIIKAN